MTAFDQLAAAWDEMDGAAKRILNATPEKLSAAAERIEAARLGMRTAVQGVMSTAAPAGDREAEIRGQIVEHAMRGWRLAVDMGSSVANGPIGQLCAELAALSRARAGSEG